MENKTGNKTEEKQELKLALFDFDGTITDKDTFMEFLKYAVGKLRFYTGFALMGPYVLGYFAGLVPAATLKEKVITYFFKDRTHEEFANLAQRFAGDKLHSYVKNSAMERINWHKNLSHRVIVVSASFTGWLEPWCKQYGLELIATELEVKNNRLTGKIAGKNCNGAEKVRRIKEALDLETYSYIYAYGNSSGDSEMLKLANEPFYRNFT